MSAMVPMTDEEIFITHTALGNLLMQMAQVKMKGIFNSLDNAEVLAIKETTKATESMITKLQPFVDGILKSQQQ
jgi:hypothetical protein